MTRLTALELASNYPDNIYITAHQDSINGLWGGFVYLCKGERIHKEMVSFKEGVYTTQKEATEKMRQIVEDTISHIQNETSS